MIIYFSGDETQLRKVATVFLQGLLKLIRSDEHAEQHPKAYMCLGLYLYSYINSRLFPMGNIVQKLQRWFVDEQNGFLSNPSTTSNLLNIITLIAENINHEKQVDVAYLDFLKVF